LVLLITEPGSAPAQDGLRGSDREPLGWRDLQCVRWKVREQCLRWTSRQG